MTAIRSTKGMRRVVDIVDSVRLFRALENYLEAHDIKYTFYELKGGVRRYFVKSSDLCCAQTCLPALRAIAEMPEND